MDDRLPECKKKMARFRIQELKAVLGHLGLAKYGNKQDLMDRILALLLDEEGSDDHSPQKNKLIRKEDVIKIINATYREMPGANNPVSGGLSASDSSSITPKQEIVDQKIRCPCGSPVKTEFMIKCADPECHTWQHVPCVIIPVESSEVAPPASPQLYCEACRIDRCDPFWKTLAHPLYPVKLTVSSVPDDGSQPVQKVETGFPITRADVHLLESAGYDVQAWCILLNDSVQYRMQWPQYPDLRVNGIPVKTISRPGSKMLGANGRDNGPSISVFLVEGFNKISLSGNDTRPFCLGVRLVKQRTIKQVIDMIPGEQEGESFTEAVARVCRCIGRGMTAANDDDSDSDLEVISDNVTINLRCPMSGCRMKTAARFKGCIHLGCFDLHTLIQINQRSRKWQCPICLKNYSLEDIIIDPYLNRIVKMIQPCDEDVTDIEVNSDGSWRAKIGRPFMDLERWHLSDGSLYDKLDTTMENSAVKSEHQLSNGNGNGNRVSDVGLPHGNLLEEYGQKIISMSSSSSEDMKDDEFNSVDNTGNKDDMMDCTPYNHKQNRNSSPSSGEPSIIVLSDSEDEIDDTVSPTGVSLPDPPNASSSRPNGEAESSWTNISKRLGDPFTFPRQPRTVRKQQHATKNVSGN